MRTNQRIVKFLKQTVIFFNKCAYYLSSNIRLIIKQRNSWLTALTKCKISSDGTLLNYVQYWNRRTLLLLIERKHVFFDFVKSLEVYRCQKNWARLLTIYWYLLPREYSLAGFLALIICLYFDFQESEVARWRG